jgi:hypothetical protein
MRMALNMQRAIAELNAKWRNEGIEHPFRVRMGVNTGFCDVGNLDYPVRAREFFARSVVEQQGRS